jgi:hypothetical protein
MARQCHDLNEKAVSILRLEPRTSKLVWGYRLAAEGGPRNSWEGQG